MKIEIDDDHKEILNALWEKYGADYSFEDFSSGIVNSIFEFFCDLFVNGSELPDIPDDFFNFGKPN